MSALNLVALPILFGLVGFVEPCSIGSTLVMIKQIEQRTPGQQIAQTVVFAVTRALFIGGAGLLAAALGSVMLGLFFGLNIPACAAPLILALLGAAAAGGASGATLVSGFVSLALFGLALSLPLVLAVSFAPARRGQDRLAALSRRLPFWTGILFAALGAWSVWFGLYVSLEL